MNKDSQKHKRFFQFYNSVHTSLYSFLFVLVHNQVDAEELLQETAAVLWEKFDTFQEGTSFGAWAIQIAKYKALEFLRSSKRMRMIFEEAAYMAISEEAEKHSPEMGSYVRALNKCLGRLVEQDYKLLSLRYRKNLSVKQIAQMIGRSRTGLYQSYSRIFELLRVCIQKKLAQMEV
jgi:RNA polymerase sigma-70 factor (ECF subfamily)